MQLINPADKQPQGHSAANKLAARPTFDPLSWVKTALLGRKWLGQLLTVVLLTVGLLWLGSWLWSALSYFSSLLLLFVSAWLVALILRPLVVWFIGRGLAKGAAIALSYLLVLLGVALFTGLVGPGLVSQTQLLLNNVGPLLGNAQNWLDTFTKSIGLGPLNLNQLGEQIQSYTTTLLNSVLAVTTGLAGFVLQILLAIIISISLLAGQPYTEPENAVPANRGGWLNLLPPRWNKQWHWLKRHLEHNIGVFWGGQLLVGLLYGLIVCLVMWAAGIPYAVTTGCICGVLMLVPLFGRPLSLFLPLILCLSTSPFSVVLVLPLLYIIQTLLLNVVLPKIVGKVNGLGPVTTLFVLLAGAQIGGIWGVVLGVPLAGLLANVSELVKRFLQQHMATTSK